MRVLFVSCDIADNHASESWDSHEYATCAVVRGHAHV